MDEKLLYRVSEVAEMLSLSKSKVYGLVTAGRLPSVKIDGLRRVKGEDLAKFVESLRVIAA